MGTEPFAGIKISYANFEAEWVGCHKDHFQTGRFHGALSGPTPVTVCVIHIMDGSMVGTRQWFNMSVGERREAQRKSGQRPVGGRSSAHFGVDALGRIEQYVRYADTAFHTVWNRGTWPNGGLYDGIYTLPGNVPPNLYTVGIENTGFSGAELSPIQYEANGWIIAQTALRYRWQNIDRTRVAAHSEFDTVNRSRCPGTGVNIDRIVWAAVQYWEWLKRKKGEKT